MFEKDYFSDDLKSIDQNLLSSQDKNADTLVNNLFVLCMFIKYGKEMLNSV